MTVDLFLQDEAGGWRWLTLLGVDQVCRCSSWWPRYQTLWFSCSYLPWFEVFYKLLNILADYTTKGQVSQGLLRQVFFTHSSSFFSFLW